MLVMQKHLPVEAKIALERGRQQTNSQEGKTDGINMIDLLLLLPLPSLNPSVLLSANFQDMNRLTMFNIIIGVV
jgi:hypothetical protein